MMKNESKKIPKPEEREMFLGTVFNPTLKGFQAFKEAGISLFPTERRNDYVAYILENPEKNYVHAVDQEDHEARELEVEEIEPIYCGDMQVEEGCKKELEARGFDLHPSRENDSLEVFYSPEESKTTFTDFFENLKEYKDHGEEIWLLLDGVERAGDGWALTFDLSRLASEEMIKTAESVLYSFACDHGYFADHTGEEEITIWTDRSHVMEPENVERVREVSLGMAVNSVEVTENTISFRVDAEMWQQLPTEEREFLEGHEGLVKTQKPAEMEIGTTIGGEIAE